MSLTEGIVERDFAEVRVKMEVVWGCCIIKAKTTQLSIGTITPRGCPALPVAKNFSLAVFLLKPYHQKPLSHHFWMYTHTHTHTHTHTQTYFRNKDPQGKKKSTIVTYQSSTNVDFHHSFSFSMLYNSPLMNIYCFHYKEKRKRKHYF